MNLFIFEYKFQMSIPIQQRYINALVVDDHSFFRKGLVSVLETIRYINKVDEASNGLEALSLLEKEKYEVVFMDFEMPEMNGEQTSQFITEKHPGTDYKRE